MPIVNFVNEKKQVQVPEGANLRTAAQEAGVKLYNGINGFGASVNEVLNCHGLGMCGTCVVAITKGMENTNKMGTWEKLKFRGLPIPDLTCMHYIGHEDTIRLACLTTVHGDIDVQTRPPFNLFGENFFS